MFHDFPSREASPRLMQKHKHEKSITDAVNGSDFECAYAQETNA